QRLFLISLYALIASTKSQITSFNYTETNLTTTSLDHQPFVLNLQTYDDGTILAHIARYDKTLIANCRSYLRINNAFGLDQILRIRVIQLDGSVKEINLNNTDLKLDPLNYCMIGTWVPIKIYALQKQFILVTYVNSTNSFDPTTYEDWGMVIDWNSNVISKTSFGPSYVENNNYWNPDLQSTIHLNINKKLGFLRVNFANKNNIFSYEWQQYSIDDSGKLSMLQNFSFPLQQIKGRAPTSFVITPMATIDGGYALIYANSTNETVNNSFFTRGSVYANFITYNNTFQDRTILLYTLTNNVTFNTIYCGIVSVGFGQVCTLSVNNSIVNNITKEYIRIYFLTSGSVLKIDVLSDLPNVTTLVNWAVSSMPFGGYILHTYDNNGTTYIYAYDEYNLKTPLVSTLSLSSNQTVPINNFSTNYRFGATVIMNNNNTFILPTTDTNIDKTSWSFINILLPKVLEYRDHGYGNLQIDQVDPPVNYTVDSTTTSLNIAFFVPVSLSNDQIHGHLTIYKTSDNSIRQKVSPRAKNFCSTSPDGKTITIKIISSTFNEFNESYYVQMDNNFVKSSLYNEPLKGISDGIWNLSSINTNNLINPSGSTIVGTVGLTNDAMKKFTSFSTLGRSNYFAQLLNKTADQIPVQRERLTTDEKFQYINNGQQIIFSIKVNLPLPDSNESTADGVAADLITMLKNKEVTTFSNDITNDLDDGYGFVPMTFILFIFIARPTKEQEKEMIEEIAGDAKKKLIGKINKKVEEFSDDIKYKIIYEKDKLLEKIEDDRQKKIVDRIFKKVGDKIKNKLINEIDKILEKVEGDILMGFRDLMPKVTKKCIGVRCCISSIENVCHYLIRCPSGDIKTKLEKVVVGIKAKLGEVVSTINKKLKKVAKKILDKIVKDFEDDTNVIINEILGKEIDNEKNIILKDFGDCIKTIIDEKLKGIGDDTKNIINEMLKEVGADIKINIDKMFEEKIIGIKVKTICEFFKMLGKFFVKIYEKIICRTNEKNGGKNEGAKNKNADETDNNSVPFSIEGLIRIPDEKDFDEKDSDEKDSDEKDSDEKDSDEKDSDQHSNDDASKKDTKSVEDIIKRIFKKIDDTLNKKDSGQPSNKDTNEDKKFVEIIEEVFNKDIPKNEVFDKDIPKNEVFYEEIPKTEVFHKDIPKNEVFKGISQNEIIDEIIKDIYNDKLYNNFGNEISDKIQSRINEKMPEILRKIFIKISIKMFNQTYALYVDNILSAKISTEIQLQLTKEPQTTKESQLTEEPELPKGLQFTTKIYFDKEINSLAIKSIIFAEIHIEVAIILLEEFFIILLEKFFNKIQEKLQAKIREIKKFKEIINEKTSINKHEVDEISAKIASEISTEISNKTKEEISDGIHEEIEEIKKYFYNILNIIYNSVTVDKGKLKISNGQETPNEGQTTNKEEQDFPIEEQNLAKEQNPPIKEQKLTKEIQNYRNTIIYEIGEIKKLFHNTMNHIKITEKDELSIYL
ncbi:17379_t:CDS:2, partial [Dentiscutata heterogama]